MNTLLISFITTVKVMFWEFRSTALINALSSCFEFFRPLLYAGFSISLLPITTVSLFFCQDFTRTLLPLSVLHTVCMYAVPSILKRGYSSVQRLHKLFPKSKKYFFEIKFFLLSCFQDKKSLQDTWFIYNAENGPYIYICVCVCVIFGLMWRTVQRDFCVNFQRGIRQNIFMFMFFLTFSA